MTSSDLQPVQRLAAQLIALAPRALLVLGVLIGGLILALLARRATRWLVQQSGLEAAAERAGASRLLYGAGYQRGLARLLAQLVWFSGLLLTLAAVSELLGLPAVATATSAVLHFLPRLLAGAAILLGGLLLATFLKRILLRFGGERHDVDSPRFVSSLAYYLILVVSITIAVRQIGFETGLVDAMLKIGLACAALSLAVAFALGARTAFSNLIARHYYERLVAPGDRLRVGESEGLVIRHSPLATVIQTERGERIIPCRLLLEQPVDVERPDHSTQPPGATSPRRDGEGQPTV